jgi:rsbT antagonist protein RsbS
MVRTDDVQRIGLQVSRGIVVASIQTDLEEAVLARFQRDVLERIHSTGARGLVLELSGLEILDPEEFEALRRIISMARVMGTDSVLVGLSAGIASSLIAAGVDVHGLRATLDIDEALGMFDAPERAEALEIDGDERDEESPPTAPSEALSATPSEPKA